MLKVISSHNQTLPNWFQKIYRNNNNGTTILFQKSVLMYLKMMATVFYMLDHLKSSNKRLETSINIQSLGATQKVKLQLHVASIYFMSLDKH